MRTSAKSRACLTPKPSHRARALDYIKIRSLLTQKTMHFRTRRCVRCSWLCGKDRRSRRIYEHCRQWLADRLHKLSRARAIELHAYAIMSNQFHEGREPERVLKPEDYDSICNDLIEQLEAMKNLGSGLPAIKKFV